MPRAFSSALVLCAAALLAACLPPPRSAIVRPAELAAAPERDTKESAPCEADALARPFGIASCEPQGFAALVRDLDPDRVIATRWDGDRTTGRPILLGPDSIRFNREPIALADLEAVDVIDDPSIGAVAARLAYPAATFAALGGAIGLANGLDGVRDGAIAGAGLGLAVGMTIARAPEVDRFDVVGWTEAPRWGVRLDTDGDDCASVRLAGELATYSPMAPCVTPQAFQDRSREGWVERIDVHLRSGERLAGARLALSEDALALDGRALRYDAVDRVVLRHPHGPLRPVRVTARATWTGALYGTAVAAGPALASGEPEVVWVGAVSGAALGALFGVLRSTLGPRDAMRETATLPTPEP